MTEPFVPLDFPPWLTWNVRACPNLPQERDAAGNFLPHCRWCRKPVPKGLRSWCSGACDAKWKRIWSWGSICEYVRQRDQTCRICGTEYPGWKLSRSSERVAFVHTDGRVSDGRGWYLSPTTHYRAASRYMP